MRFRLTVFREGIGVSHVYVEAQTEAAAVDQTRSSGADVISVRSERDWLGAISLRPGSFPLLLISQELLTLLKAGVTLIEAFETLTEKEQSKEVEGTLQRILQDLRAGQALSSALERHPRIFPTLYVATVRASERTGDLVNALARYVAYRLQLETARKKLVTALIYPSLLVSVGLIVSLFLLIYVVPRFSKILEDRATDIPVLTKVLIAWGSFLNNHPFVLFAAFLTMLIAAVAVVTRPMAKIALIRALRALPKIGERLRVYQLSRMYRTLGMLLKSGTPVATALGMVRDLIDESMLESFDRAARRIKEGISISVAMHDQGLTTPVAVRILRVGEQTGTMADMMERLAEIYDEENSRTVEMLSRVFEPVLMAIIGLVIGAIVVLMYLPIFELASSVQ